jgi:hypothetical protein
MNITTATPAAIDAELARLYLAEAKAEQRVASALVTLRRALDQRENRSGRRPFWPISAPDTIDTARARAAAGDTAPSLYSYRPFAELVDTYDTAVAGADAIEAEAAPLNAEFARRGGWSRFFVVQNNNGHIHSSMSCQTCNRNGARTEFGWNPELSGLSEAEAVAKLGPSLCTVCFPTAPVEWTEGKPGKPACDGSGNAPVSGTVVYYARSMYAECAGCSERHPVTGAGVIRKHPPKKTA